MVSFDEAANTEECIRVQEFSLLRVPYETLNRKFRVGQRIIDKEVTNMNALVSDIHKLRDNPKKLAKKKNEIKKKLDAARERMKKISLSQNNECTTLRNRLQHLQSFKNNLQSWNTDRFYRQLTEYLFQFGFQETSLKLAQILNLNDLVNANLFVKIKDLESSLRKQSTAECLAWCSENKSRLRKIKSRFEWELRLQNFITLIKEDKRMEAMEYARKFMTDLVPQSAKSTELGAAMALLVFQPTTHVGAYKALFSEDRWENLCQICRNDVLRVHQVSDTSVFEATLEAGLSSLKTHQCYSNYHQSDSCPVCSVFLNSIAKRLPYSHCTQSQFICAASGDDINENNPPLMLPNGNVYGKRAISLLTNHVNDTITCPRTNQTFSKYDFKKVYFL